MIQTLRNRIAGKKVLILGFGREGKSTYQALRAAGGYASLAVADQSLRDFSLEPEVRWFSGAEHQKAALDFDLIFKSPGVVLKPEIEEGLRKRPGDISLYLTSQTQEFFSRYREQIIGITGTKGKSTTTTLLFHILKENGFLCLLAGNIGIPVFDIAGQMKEDTQVICELSCHQLEYMTVSPRIGILTNIHEEHLDHYGTMEKYVASKEKIYENQMPEDVLYVHPSVAPEEGRHKGICILVEEEIDIKSKGDIILKGTRISYGGKDFEIPVEKVSLLGAHNYLDIAFVYGICTDLGISDEQFEGGLISYVPLPHRLQYIGTVDGVAYYDDSISTIDETTIQALNTIGNADTVLIGGMDRDISYVNLEKYLASSKVAHIILMEATGKRIYREIMENMPDFAGKERLYVVDHLEEAVSLAKEITAKGGSCILSPAAASYGIFKDFEKRGDCFQRLVLEEEK